MLHSELQGRLGFVSETVSQKQNIGTLPLPVLNTM